MNLIYGPVQSLRYGTTLGVNLLGGVKVCSYNCVYCRLGPTELTMNKIRKEYTFPSLEEIKGAFREQISKPGTYSRIMISGNGEPTLHDEFDEACKLILGLRDEHFPGVPVGILSNGAHLDNKRVVTGMNLLDERVIKLDAGTDNLLNKFNDPLVRITVSKLIAGIAKLQDCVVQSMFTTGAVDNSSGDVLDEWIEIVGMVKPKSVQICTLTDPGPVAGLLPLSEDALDAIAFKLKKRTGLDPQVFSAKKA